MVDEQLVRVEKALEKLGERITRVESSFDKLSSRLDERCAERKSDIAKNTQDISHFFDYSRKVKESLTEEVTKLKLQYTKTQVLITIVQAVITAIVVGAVVAVILPKG